MKYFKLGDVCKIEKGTTGINRAIPGKYPLVVTSEERKSHNEFQFDDDAVIIPLVSSTGHGHRSLKRIHYQSGKFALGTILCAVIPRDKTLLNAEYLYRYLDLNRERELVSRMKGMANVTLPIKEIVEIKILVPSLQDQHRFVQNYSVLERKSSELSTELTHQLDLVKHLRQAFLSEAMQGKLVPQDPNDEPASELLKRIKAGKARLIKEGKLKKEKELPPIRQEEVPFEIPESWVWCRLGEIAYIASGSTPKQDAFVKLGVPYLKMYNLKEQRIDFDHKPQYIKREVHEGQLRRSRAVPGDLIMNIVGPPLGKLAIVPQSLKECNLNQAGVVIRGIDSTLNNWLFWYLNEQSEINSIATKGVAGQDNISVTQTKNMRIPLPSISEQSRIVTKLNQLTHHCDQLEQSIKQSQAQNEQLLQQVLREALRNG